MTNDPRTLHPTNLVDENAVVIFTYTQGTLTRRDLDTKKSIPLLVEALPEISRDGLRYTYTIREGVKWDDGSPLTAADVLFTLKAIKSPLTDNVHKSTYFNIKGLEIDSANPRRFTMVAKTIHFKNPYVFDEL
ncbi:MAG: ABC transporter substrate-binding protein, partial [Bacteroidota bacterium]|nr:ABC transporter substrate-binding protein [Bacteroidota bacterium]